MLQNISLHPNNYHLNKLKFQEQTYEFKKICLRSPVLFYEICSFLDNDTIFECKFVCASSRKLVKKDLNLENKALKVELRRIKYIVWGDQEKELKKEKIIDPTKIMDYKKIGKLKLSKKLSKQKEILLKFEKNEKSIKGLLMEYDLSQELYKKQFEYYNMYANTSLYYVQNFPSNSQIVNIYNQYSNNEMQHLYRYHDYYKYDDLDFETLIKLSLNIEVNKPNIFKKTTRFIHRKLNNIIEMTEGYATRKYYEYFH